MLLAVNSARFVIFRESSQEKTRVGLNTIADSETELNERINMVTPTTTGTPERWAGAAS